VDGVCFYSENKEIPSSPGDISLHKGSILKLRILLRKEIKWVLYPKEDLSCISKLYRV